MSFSLKRRTSSGFDLVEQETVCFVTNKARGGHPSPNTTKGLFMQLKVNALDHIVINVADVARSVDWYRKVLGMEVKVFDPGQGKAVRTSLLFGDQKINVRPRGADKVEWFTADHEVPGSDDLCFLTDSTPDQVVSHLKTCGVAIEEGPVTKQGARGALRSVYCRDPDGSLIEISSYESESNPRPVAI
jgi:catechol 2,3-dioxygenase-like lactoylglutathione lyase family enzyme